MGRAKKTPTDGILAFPTKVAGNKQPRMAFGQMLKDYRQKANIDQTTIGKICGVTGNAVSNWERDIARPDVSLVPTLSTLLNIPLYAFFGMSNPYGDSDDEQAMMADYRSLTDTNKRQMRRIMQVVMDSQEEAARESHRKEYCRVVYRDGALAAGFGGPLDEDPDAHTVFVRRNKLSNTATDIFPVNGDSMQPDYPNGSQVYVKRVTDASEIHDGDVIACVVAGTPYIKIYKADGLHSTNPKYKVIHVTDDDHFVLFGRVLGCVDPDDYASEEETAELMAAFGIEK